MADVYGGFDFMAAGNALSQMQDARQKQQYNAMIMQNTMEDRARADQARKLAAGNALAARAKAQKIAGVYEQGFNPGKTAVMGPGTVQGSTEPSYDYNKTALEFLKLGETGKAEELFKLPEARKTAGAEYMEKDAKARVEALKAETETYNTALARVKPVLAQAISIDGLMHYVDVVDADPVLGPLAIKTGGPTEARKEAIRKMAAPKEAGGGGMTVDQIAQRLGGIDGYALKNMDIDFQKKEAEIAKQNADAAKARGEAGGGGSGGTENERNRQLLARAMQDPEYVKTPEYAALFNMSFGPKMVEVQDPNGPPGQMINRVVNVPAPDVFPRPTFGQNALAPAPAATPPTNALAMANRYGGGAGAPTAQAPIATPPTLSVDMRTGENMVTKQPAPSGEREKQAIAKETAAAGKPKVTDTIQKMMDTFEKYNSLGGMVSDEKSFKENVVPYLSSGMFKDAMPLANPKAATQKQVLDSLVETAVKQIAAAAGLTAKQMDSNADVQRLRAMVADPEKNITIEAAREILSNIDATYGTGTAKRTAPATATSDKIARSVDIEHTAKQNNMSLEDTKARLRSMGYKIEGE